MWDVERIKFLFGCIALVFVIAVVLAGFFRWLFRGVDWIWEKKNIPRK